MISGVDKGFAWVSSFSTVGVSDITTCGASKCPCFDQDLGVGGPPSVDGAGTGTALALAFTVYGHSGGVDGIRSLSQRTEGNCRSCIGGGSANERLP